MYDLTEIAPKDCPSKNIFRDTSYINQIVEQVDKNGVHTNNPEEERPFFPAFHIDDPIKSSHQNEPDTTSQKVEGTCPAFFDNRVKCTQE
jgi:hypothetical protein